ncbi:MAG: fatty acid hydroxylase [Ignavibacteria bacterium]|nr:fatty acid hydroxylase [Ignavibacteria bacterium]
MTKNYISNKDESVRMFNNDFLEKFSRVHWTVPLILFIPIILFFLYRTLFVFKIDFTQTILLVALGLFVWTFTEYFLHRFIFHYEPSSKVGKRLHFMLHGVHHDYPKDSKRLVMVPTVSLPLASLFYILFLFIFDNVNVNPFFAGFLIGYLFYDITHYAIHHFNMHSKFWLFIKNHHMKHHYQADDKGFGVSQPLWDFVFGTDFTKAEREIKTNE